MKFRTEVDILHLPHMLDYTSRALFIGSCFTTNIGAYLQRYKFAVDSNPFGVVYNPASVVNSIDLLLDNRQFVLADLCQQNGLWFSYTHHSSFSSPDADACLQQINTRMRQSADFIKNIDFIFITLGSAYAYQLKQSGRVVANCHKTPAKEFDRILLSVNNIVDSFSALFNRLLALNPRINIVFSVSPVRHLKDGAHGNQLSKATLMLAIDELQRRYAATCFYFDAYEVLLDDLRDYRFYADDMCHPSTQAVEYIWDKFRNAAINNVCEPVMRRLDDIAAACAHRPFNPNTAQHKTFQQKIIQKIEELKAQYPFMDFTDELDKLR